jgi:diguanylate cyclase (GGDEF)-like protein/PAS domain S-box-containing protein
MGNGETGSDGLDPQSWGPIAMDGWMQVPAAMLEGLPDAVVASDAQGQIVFVNARAEELFGYRRAELLGCSVQRLWPEHVRTRYARGLSRFFTGEARLRFSGESWGLRRDGTEFVGEISWGTVHTADGPLLLAIGRDVTDRRANEARLRAVVALGERALAGTDAATLATDAVELMAETLPIAGAEVRTAGEIVLAATGALTGPLLRMPIGAGDTLYLSSERPLNDQELSHARALANTLTAAFERLRGEEQTRHDAVHDPLTGLANRTLLHDRLRHAIANSARDTSTAAVLFVDLDEFKAVNDRYGHVVGDAVLVEVARRLRGAVRPGDTIARYGGDEFIAICEQSDASVAAMVGERILTAVQAPMRIAGVEHRISASVGIALGRGDSELLLAAADAAAYRAKANGRGRFEIA